MPSPGVADRDVCRIKFWGVRGSIPTPGPTTVFYGGNTSCIEVRADDQIIILDAGTGIRPLGLALAAEFKNTPLEITLLISHTHWDHIQGFPFFLPAYNAGNKLRILGYEGARAGLAQTLAGQMESSYFPVALKEMPGNIVIEELKDLRFQIGRIRGEACIMNHPGVAVGYRLATSAGTIAYLPDNESSGQHVHQNGGGSDGAARGTDAKLVEFIQGVDVLIIDSQFDEEEYKRHIGWGHGCVNDVVRLALESGVGRLYLFHHDPNHDDQYVTNMLNNAREFVAASGKRLHVEAAREGAEIFLPNGTGE